MIRCLMIFALVFGQIFLIALLQKQFWPAGILAVITLFMYALYSDHKKSSSPILDEGLQWALSVWALIPGLLGFFLCYNRGGFDIAWYSQAIWNTAKHGVPLITVALPLHHMSNHCEPIIYLLGALYNPFAFFIPAYMFLFAVQWIINIAILLTLLRLRYGLQLCFALVFMHWGYFAANHFEFHPPTLGLSLFLFSFALDQKGYRKIAISISLLSSLCGEMFVLIGPTVAALYTGRGKRMPIIVAFVASITILLSYFKMFKQMFALDGNYTDFVSERYSNLGTSVIDIATFPFRHTLDFMQIAFSTDKLWFLGKLLIPLIICFWVLWLNRKDKTERSIRFSYLLTGTLIVLAPLAKILLGDYAPYIRNDVHYVADLLPGLFLILVAGFNTMKVSKISVTAAVWIGGCLLLACGPLQLTEIKSYGYFAPSLMTTEVRTYLRSIDPHTSIYSDNSMFSAELANRDNYFSPFADSYLKQEGLPDIVVLSWPPEHFNQGTIDAKSFRRSFRMTTSDTFTSYYRDRAVVYRKIRSFHLINWGDLTLWQRL